MNIKRNTGLAGMDMIIAIVAIIIFTTLILALMCNNAIENVKVAKETMAMIYITEIFENIGIAEYDNVSEENVNDFIPQEVSNNYDVEIIVDDEVKEVPENQENQIIKKITATLTYEVGNKTYSCSMERLKIKE